MSWNYRIVKTEGQGWGLYEVYYDKDGNPKSVTLNPIDFFNEDVKDLASSFELAGRAFEKPVLQMKIFDDIAKKEIKKKDR